MFSSIFIKGQCNSQYFEAAKFVDTSKLFDYYLGFAMPEILTHEKS
jgi:hypothetical protein